MLFLSFGIKYPLQLNFHSDPLVLLLGKSPTRLVYGYGFVPRIPKTHKPMSFFKLDQSSLIIILFCEFSIKLAFLLLHFLFW